MSQLVREQPMPCVVRGRVLAAAEEDVSAIGKGVGALLLSRTRRCLTRVHPNVGKTVTESRFEFLPNSFIQFLSGRRRQQN
jgi:hypothetical protein